MIIYDSRGRIVLEVTVDDNSYRNRAIMGDNSLTLHYSLAEHVEIPVGAYCNFENARYTLMRPESFKMKHSRNFQYTVIMESAEAKAKMWKFRNPVDGRLKFSLTAKPHDHLQMFVDNMNRRDSGWTVGECVKGAEVLISYDHAYCYDALAQMASELKTEFEFNAKTVSLRKVEYDKNSPLALSYGRGNGFKPNVGRGNYGDKIPVEILFIQGGSDNIDRSKYGSNELLLPKNQTIKYDGKYFEDEQGFNSSNARSYVVDDLGFSIRRADKELSSLAEDSLDCSEIYPKRVGEITSVVVVDSKNNFYDFIDNTIPTTLNYEDYLIEGETMSVIFQSGMLAGKEFDVKYYHNAKGGKAARRFEIVPQDIDGQTMPNDIFKPVDGDTYAVFGCMLPDAYIRDNATKKGAEWDMFRSAVKYMFDNEDMQFSFTGELDGLWAKRDWINIGGKIKLGGFIKFSDEHFQQEGVLVRITGIKDYINNPHSPELTLSNSTVTSWFGTTMQELKSEEVLLEDYHRSAIQYTKRRFRDAKETISMLEEALLDNFTNSISPIAVQTMSMLVGDESLQFRFVKSLSDLTQVGDTVVYDGSNKQLTVGASVIQHLTLGIKDISSSHTGKYKTWSLPAFTSAVMTDGTKKYYLYAKCSDTGKTGEFVLSEKAIGMDEASGYYHLLVGVLNSEYGGERSFVPLYGFTEVLPGRITTDRIVSSDGKTYFDLDNSEIGGNIKFTGSNGEDQSVSDVVDNINDSIADMEEYLAGIPLSGRNLVLDTHKPVDTRIGIPAPANKVTYPMSATWGEMSKQEWGLCLSFDYELEGVSTGGGNQRRIGLEVALTNTAGTAFNYYGAWLYLDANVTGLTRSGHFVQYMGIVPQGVSDAMTPATISAHVQCTGGHVVIRNIKIEVCDSEDKATPWTPAPEDAYKAEAGGENLIGESDPFEIQASTNSSNFKGLAGPIYEWAIVNREPLENGANYVFSVRKIERTAGTAEYCSIYLFGGINGANFTTNSGHWLKVQDWTQYVYFTVPDDERQWGLIIYAGIAGQTQGNGMKFHGMMLQKGDKPTAYQPYMKSVAEAIKGTTEIAGGLVLANAILVKGGNSKVYAGINGVAGQYGGAVIWTGADLKQLSAGNAVTQFNADGSGWTADKNIKWDKNGALDVGIMSVQKDRMEIDNQSQRIVFSKRVLADETQDKESSTNNQRLALYNINTSTQPLIGVSGSTRTYNLERDANWTGHTGYYVFNGKISIGVMAMNCNICTAPSPVARLAITNNDGTEVYSGNGYCNIACYTSGNTPTEIKLATFDVNTGFINGPFKIHVQFNVGSTERTGSGTYDCRPALFFNGTLNSIDNQFIMAKDGLLVKISKDNLFKIQQDDKGLRVSLRGLGTDPTYLEKGDLYINMKFPLAFIDLLNALEDTYADNGVQFNSNGKERREKMRQTIQRLKQQVQSTLILSPAG